MKSCTRRVAQADGREVTTIEGMATDGAMHPLQEAFHRNHVAQWLRTPDEYGRGVVPEGEPDADRGRTSASRSRATSVGARATRRRDVDPRRGRADVRRVGVKGAGSVATAQTYVGSTVLRKEDPELLAGEASFVDNWTMPGMPGMTLVRPCMCTHAPKSIDTSA